MHASDHDTLHGRRILVVGINYAPEQAGIAPYTTQVCVHLQALGAMVQVFTGLPHYPNWRVPRKYRRGMRFDEICDDVAVRRIRHYVPAKQTAVRRALYELSFGFHVLCQRVRNRPNLVLAVVPGLASAAAAAIIARWAKAPLLIWIQDLMGPAAAQSGIPGGFLVTGVTEKFEGWVLRQAASVCVLNEAFSRYAETQGVPSAKIHTIPNWTHIQPPSADRGDTRKRLAWPAETLVALYTGNMGLKQGLENIVEAARQAAVSAPNIRFVIMGDGSQRTALEQMAKTVPSLELLSPVPLGEYSNVLAAADVLLVNEAPTVLDMSVPSKLTSYAVAGRPVVAAVRSEGGTASELRRLRGAFIVPPGRPDKLIAAILEAPNRPADEDTLISNWISSLDLLIDLVRSSLAATEQA